MQHLEQERLLPLPWQMRRHKAALRMQHNSMSSTSRVRVSRVMRSGGLTAAAASLSPVLRPQG